MEPVPLKAWELPTTVAQHYLESALFSVEGFLKEIYTKCPNESLTALNLREY
jgi:hypothetical protein